MTEPHIIAPNFDTIHRSLKALPRWILWRLEEVDGRWTKVPYRADGRAHASTSDPRTWSGFEVVKRAYERGGFAGVGFCRAGQMVFVDVDGGIVITPSGAIEFVNFPGWPAELQPSAVALAARMAGAWLEVSPSGTGFHAYGTAQGKPETLQRMVNGEDHMGIAVYTTNRFFAVTGMEL